MHCRNKTEKEYSFGNLQTCSKNVKTATPHDHIGRLPLTLNLSGQSKATYVDQKVTAARGLEELVLLPPWGCGAFTRRRSIGLVPRRQDRLRWRLFRPIRLKNCSEKWIAKVLALRLQKESAKLIDGHRTGFLRGRTMSIAESFIHAVELTQLYLS
jgi:hypothetical protein